MTTYKWSMGIQDDSEEDYWQMCDRNVAMPITGSIAEGFGLNGRWYNRLTGKPEVLMSKPS